MKNSPKFNFVEGSVPFLATFIIACMVVIVATTHAHDLYDDDDPDYLEHAKPGTVNQAEVEPCRLYCYFCRSDKNPQCLHQLENSTKEFSRPCTVENMQKYNGRLEGYPYTHSDPKYFNEVDPLDGPVNNSMLRCYTALSTDKLRMVRSCIPLDRDDHPRCADCVMNGHNSTCCICKEPFCNRNGQSSQYSSHFYLKLVIVQLTVASIAF